MASYTRFFETKCPSFLLESIYVTSYSDLNCLALKVGDDVTLLFENLEEKQCQERALNLFSSECESNRYFSTFNKFLEEAEAKSNLYISEKKSSALIKLFLKFLSLYRYTESFYTDLAYKKKNNNAILTQNLIILEQIKTKARIYLNLFFNGKDSFIQRIAETTNNSEKFLYSTVEEIFENVETKKENIILRKQNHVFNNKKIYPENKELYQEIKKWKDLQEIKIDNKIKGISASLGYIKGKAFVLSANFTNFDILDKIIDDMPNDVILVSETTAPDIVRACYKAKGIITNQGGLGSHAAIISRELNIPCIVGTKIATKTIQTGDLITLDANKGEIIINE